MRQSSKVAHPLLPAIKWSGLAPALLFALWAVALFVAGLVLAREFAGTIEAALSANRVLGILVFVGTSALAVLLPMLTNLALVPLAAVAWGPWWAALLLLAGWIAGAALSFVLARRSSDWVVRHLPALQRHARIDQLIHPQHRMLSLILLRMTFPVDVLSYALGMFSPRTTLAENLLSTALGAAPFALLFAFVPVLPPAVQWWLVGASVFGFLLYIWWVLGAGTPR